MMGIALSQDELNDQARAGEAAAEDAPESLIEQVGRYLFYVDTMPDWGDLCRRWWDTNRGEYLRKAHGAIARADMLPPAERPDVIAAFLFGLRWSCPWGDPSSFWFTEFEALYRDRGEQVARIIFRFDKKAPRQ